MSRLNETQSQSSHIIGAVSPVDKGSSDLQSFDRPILKQVKLAYSSTNPRPKSPSSISSAADTGRGFFGRSNNNSKGSNGLPLTSAASSTNPSSSNHGGNVTEAMNAAAGTIRSKMRAAVAGRESGRDALPDWSRSDPSPSRSFSSSRQRTQSDIHLNTLPQYTMSASLGRNDADYFTDEHTNGTNRRRSSDIATGHHQQNPASSSSSLHKQNNHNNHHNHPPHSASLGGSISDLHDQQMTNAETQRSLRQRKTDYPPSPHGNATMINPSRNRQPNRAASGSSIPEDSPYRGHNNSSRTNIRTQSHWILFHKLRSKCGNIRGWNIGHFLQVTVGLLVILLLYDSHCKATLIAQRLKEFKSEEAMVFLHLHRIEQQSIQLHGSLQDFDPSQVQHNDGDGDKNAERNHLTDKDRSIKSPDNLAPRIDSALIQKQTQQLLQMEEELSHEVRTLQTRIQHSAVRSIVHEYGEGPVQVILEVIMNGQTSKVSILLWHDTPHAAWTWLEQISRRLWDGAVFHLENNRIMNVASTREETAGTRLDFVERSQQRHESWTVGLVEPSSLGETGQDVGGLQLFINLQDNTDFSKHDVCIGKVFDGFDVLHQIVDESREMQQRGEHTITVRTARASHLTNRETKGLI